MRKSLIQSSSPGTTQPPSEHWLDLAAIAQVEISSEDPLFPIEHALGAAVSSGWRASCVGPQVVRIIFDHPTPIRRISLHFIDRASERSQEFALYATHSGHTMQEVVRQQFSFSPGGATEEIEDYTVDLHGVTVLELRIDPDRAHDPAHSRAYATLNSLRLA